MGIERFRLRADGEARSKPEQPPAADGEQIRRVGDDDEGQHRDEEVEAGEQWYKAGQSQCALESASDIPLRAQRRQSIVHRCRLGHSRI